MEKYSNTNEKLIYLLVGLFSLVSLLVSVLIYDDYKTLGSFLKELAFAGFIALIVIFTVERFSKERHRIETENLVKDINKNLFKAVYGRYIPNSVFNEVERLLLGVDIFRKNYNVTYSIEEINKKDNFFKCKVQTSYEIKNISEESVKHSVFNGLEQPLDKDLLENCGLEAISIGEKNLTLNEIEQHTETKDGQIKFNYPIEIKPESTIKVEMIGTLFKLKTDQEIWNTVLPSDGIKLTVTKPERLGVFARSIHSRELNLILDTETKRVWEIPHGMLPNQGIVFWWID